MTFDDFLIGFFIALVLSGAALKKLLGTDTGKQVGMSLLNRWFK
jgi:hypothetical protein